MTDGSTFPKYISLDQINPIINIDRVDMSIILAIKIIGTYIDGTDSSEVI
jgi:hypothetical protein